MARRRRRRQNYRYRLHALRLKDGTPLAPPVVIDAPGLDARNTRSSGAGLLLTGGVLYIAFGGDGSRGLLLAYDAATLARKAVWASTPTGQDGGIWQAGQAPAVDADGNVYLMTGNGTFDAHAGGANYGESFVKLRLEGNALVVKDYFTPCNASFLNSRDMDLGSVRARAHPRREPRRRRRQGRPPLPPVDHQHGQARRPARSRNAATCPNPNALQDSRRRRVGHLHGSPVFWRGL